MLLKQQQKGLKALHKVNGPVSLQACDRYAICSYTRCCALQALKRARQFETRKLLRRLKAAQGERALRGSLTGHCS